MIYEDSTNLTIIYKKLKCFLENYAGFKHWFGILVTNANDAHREAKSCIWIIA